MAWLAVAVVGSLFVLPFLLAALIRERSLAADAEAPFATSGPYDWDFDDDFGPLDQRRPA